MRVRYGTRSVILAILLVAGVSAFCGYRWRRLKEFRDCRVVAKENGVELEVAWWPGGQHQDAAPDSLVGKTISIPYVTGVTASYPDEYTEWFDRSARLGNWKYAILHGERFDGRHLDRLAQMGSVEELDFVSEQMSAEMADTIPRLNSLRSLRIYTQEFAPEFAMGIASLPALLRLDFSLNVESMPALRQFQSMSSIQSLSIELLDAPQAYPFETLQSFTTLESLAITGMLTDKNMIDLREVFPRLKKVSLNAGALSDFGLAQLNEGSDLQHLSLTSLGSNLNFLEGRTLQHLSLHEHSLSVAAFAEASSCRIRSLEVTGTINAECAAAIASWKYLVELDITGAEISREDIKMLKNSRVWSRFSARPY